MPGRLAKSDSRTPGLTRDSYDVAIIGAGVVGCAIARSFAIRGWSTLVVEKAKDVLEGASKGNSAILHNGFDEQPDSAERKMVRAGCALYRRIHHRMKLPLVETGALVVAWSPEQVAKLDAIGDLARRNGITDVAVLGADELAECEPHLSKAAKGALAVPGEAIIDPWSAPLAYLRQALLHGGALVTEAAVHAIVRRPEGWRVVTAAGEFAAMLVVSAAGLFADHIETLRSGRPGFSIRPRKGQFLVFDKPAHDLVTAIILKVPTERTKGVLLTRTVFGNLLLGPTAEDQQSRTHAPCEETVLRQMLAEGISMLPALADETVSATFAGLRPATEHRDYVLAVEDKEQWITVAGVRSTGLSAALGLGEWAAENGSRLLGEGRAAPPDDDLDWPAMPKSQRLLATSVRAAGSLADRMSLRVGDRVGNQGGASRADPARHARGAQAADAGDDGPLPRIWLHGGSPMPGARALPGRAGLIAEPDVMIVGGGPAGLAAAQALAARGVDRVLVVEREAEVGGIPRICRHATFGLTDFLRPMSGPSYASRLRAMVDGSKICTGATVTAIAGDLQVSVSQGCGTEVVRPKRILLATGIRETPRAARLVSGDRPQNVLTTGAVQRLVQAGAELPFRAPVVIGTELVSFSAVLTLRHAGIKPVAMIESGPRIVARRPADLLTRYILRTARHDRAPSQPHQRVGIRRLEAGVRDGRRRRGRLQDHPLRRRDLFGRLCAGGLVARRPRRRAGWRHKGAGRRSMLAAGGSAHLCCRERAARGRDCRVVAPRGHGRGKRDRRRSPRHFGAACSSRSARLQRPHPVRDSLGDRGSRTAARASAHDDPDGPSGGRPNHHLGRWGGVVAIALRNVPPAPAHWPVPQPAGFVAGKYVGHRLRSGSGAALIGAVTPKTLRRLVNCMHLQTIERACLTARDSFIILGRSLGRSG